MSKHSFLFELLGQATMTEAYDEHFIFITWKAICKVFDFGVLLLCSFLLVLLCLILFAGSNLCPVFSYQFLSARSSTVSPLCFVWVPVAWILTHSAIVNSSKERGEKKSSKTRLTRKYLLQSTSSYPCDSKQIFLLENMYVLIIV